MPNLKNQNPTSLSTSDLSAEISPRFAHSSDFSIGEHTLTPQEIQSLMAEYLTPERVKRIAKTVEGRTCDVAVVLEGVSDLGNLSAVMRSAEAMGVQRAHVIQLSEKFKAANRVSKGADKWLDVEKWHGTLACTRELKRQGYQIVATHLDERAKPISEIDFTKPTAIVFGNEKDGITPEMIAEADHTMIIPMQGFVQSFNISVAAAIAIYHIYLERMKAFGKMGNLTDIEKEFLKAEFCLRSSDDPERLLSEVLSRRES